MSDERHIEHVHLVASRQVWTILGVLVTVILGGAGYWINSVDAEQEKITQRVEAVSQTQANATERLVRLEESVSAIREGQKRQEDDTRAIRKDVQRLLEMMADERAESRLR